MQRSRSRTGTRLVAAVLTAAAVGAAGPSAASAMTIVVFSTQPGSPPRVDAMEDMGESPVRIELVRAGAVIAESPAGFVEVPELRPGDIARVSRDTTPLASATYDGTPALGELCVGSTTFTVSSPPEDRLFEAGVGIVNGDEIDPIESTLSPGAPAVVTVTRPLAAGDTAYVSGLSATEELFVGTFHAAVPKDCKSGGPPGATPEPPAPKPGEEQRTTGPSAAAAAAKLRQLGRARLARGRSVALPFAFPERGTVRFRLLARGKVIGTGTRTRKRTGGALVTTKLSPAGRSLLKRSTRLKVTVNATFTPSRAGAKPQRASVSVLLRR